VKNELVVPPHIIEALDGLVVKAMRADQPAELPKSVVDFVKASGAQGVNFVPLTSTRFLLDVSFDKAEYVLRMRKLGAM
jgi:hypothetical protein